MGQLVKVKTEDLSGAALDWAVTLAAYNCEPWQLDYELCGTWYAGESSGGYNEWNPSENWVQCGPLIERFNIGFLIFPANDQCPVTVYASVHGDEWDCNGFTQGEQNGETHLIAACRAIVAAKLGLAVDVPAKLVN